MNRHVQHKFCMYAWLFMLTDNRESQEFVELSFVHRQLGSEVRYSTLAR
jgi:hypothetical protein